MSNKLYKCYTSPIILAVFHPYDVPASSLVWIRVWIHARQIQPAGSRMIQTAREKLACKAMVRTAEVTSVWFEQFPDGFGPPFRTASCSRSTTSDNRRGCDRLWSVENCWHRLQPAASASLDLLIPSGIVDTSSCLFFALHPILAALWLQNRFSLY